MLDPEGDSQPTLPGDGAPPTAVAVRGFLEGLSDYDSAVALRACVEHFAVRAKERSIPGHVIHAARGFLRCSADYLGSPDSDYIRMEVAVYATSLVAFAETWMRPCEVCNDVGVVSRGEPCPTGCSASLRAQEEPERPQGPTTTPDHPASVHEDTNPA